MKAYIKLEQSIRQIKSGILSASLVTLFSCLAAAPLVTIALDFAKDLLVTSAQNHSPKYSDDIAVLLTAILSEGTKISKKKGRTKRPTQAEEEEQPEWPLEPQSGEQVEMADMDGQVQQDGADMPSLQDANDTINSSQLAVDIAILVNRARDDISSPPVPIEDGEILYSDPSNPLLGDKIKISLASRCDCYVYIIGIDSTGFVVPIYPDYLSIHSAKMQADSSFVVPAGTEWYGLDSFEGYEEIYFIVSKTQRYQLEKISRKFAGQTRTKNKKFTTYQTAAILPRTRGLVKINTQHLQTAKTPSGKEFRFTPNTFLSTIEGQDLILTRWFYHQNI